MDISAQGTVNRRMGRTLAHEVSHNNMRAAARDSAQDNAQTAVNDSSRPMEWKYRGRGDMEVDAHEPLPAPTGLSAQRDEGFQRFYKAVVSPTHVRVTAGGRIVPNTRGPPSPSSKKTSDSPIIDNQRASESSVGKPVPAPIAIPQPVPILPQFLPGFPSGFQPLQTPVSFVPMALPPGFPLTPTVVSPTAMAPLIPAPMNNTKTADDNNQPKAKPVVPEGFYYNGQVVYPMGAFPAPVANSMVPVQMVGIPHGGIAPQVPRQYVQSQPPRSSTMDSGLSQVSATESLSGIPSIPNIVPANANFNGNSAPPITSIKPSDITKKQIATFKQNLKWHEDQLQYNRHQIDEKDMEKRIQIIKGHIQRFEATLQTQLEYEAAYAKAMKEKEMAKAAQTANKDDQVNPSTGSMKSDDASNQNAGNSTNQVGKPVLRGSGESAGSNPTGLSKMASLPSDAALAPVFQPRGYASTWTSAKYAKELKAYGEAEKRLLAMESKSMEQMRTVSQPFTAPTGPAGKTERKSNASDSSSRSGSSKQHNYGVPYLLGTLPKGTNPRTATSQDYVYKRPLTEEELRARFLYWGKAPKQALKGLPKFDGKHFYPPSPVKEPSTEASQNDVRQATGSGSDPSRSRTPGGEAEAKSSPSSEQSCAASRHTRTSSFETQVNVGREEPAAEKLRKAFETPTSEHAEVVEHRSDSG
jgi:hypothetical protein